MKTETDTNQTINPPPEPDPEIISLADTVRMILKHRFKIAIFTVLVTTFSAVLFFLSPRQYKAEGLLQVIPPITIVDERIDRDLFETIIISRLQTIQSAFIAKDVCTALNTGTVAISAADLQGKVKITRPPKSNLIILTATDPSSQRAITIVKLWIQKYLASIRRNNVSTALCQVRSMLKKAQAGLMETQAKANQMKAIAEQTHPVIDLARGIDNNQLWQELADNAPPDKLKNLSQIHIKGQEQNADYLTVKTMFYNADQALAAANANRNFLQEVEGYLESKDREMENGTAANPASFSSNAVQFAGTMLKATDVIEIGEPALKGSSRGASSKTAIAFFVSLIAASLCAYLAEWIKTIKI